MDKSKKISCLIIIIVSLLICSSCQNEIKNKSTESERYLEELEMMGTLAENKAVDFYFYFPENWILHRNDAMIVIYAYDDDVLKTSIKDPGSDDNFDIATRPNISTTVFSLPNDKYETIDKYWTEFAVPNLEEIFQNVSNEADEELTVAGMDAKKYTYTLSSAGMEFKGAQIIFFNKNKSQVYSLTYTATEQKHDVYMHVLNTVASTFEFKN